jgi:2-dehydropantoate 2-reductase
MGSLFASRLSSCCDVWLIGHWQAHLEAIRWDGLRLVFAHSVETHPIAVTSNPREAAGADLALVLVKSYQTEAAAETARQVLSPDGLVITLQNGLGNLEILADRVGVERATLGVTSAGATVLGPGQVRVAALGATTLGTRPEIDGRLRVVAELFNTAGFETILSSNLDGLVWGKLVVNAGINPLTALLRVPNGVLLDIPTAAELMAGAAQEAAQVAAVHGIQLPYADPVAQVRDVARRTATNRSSMLQDVLRRSRTEIDAINGAIARVAGQLGVPAPVNRTLAQLVRALEDSQSSVSSQCQ